MAPDMKSLLTVNGPDMKKGKPLLDVWLLTGYFHTLESAAYFMAPNRPTQQALCQSLVRELEGLGGRTVSRGNGCVRLTGREIQQAFSESNHTGGLKLALLSRMIVNL